MPYDADHVLKLDLEQEKLVQVMKLGLSVVRTRNDPWNSNREMDEIEETSKEFSAWAENVV